MGYPRISLYGITGYKSGYVGITRDTFALISGMARDIPISAFFERVISGYPHLCMLKIAYSWLLNSEIALNKLMEALFFTAAAAQLRSRLVLTAPSQGARSPAPASAPSPAGGVGGSSAPTRLGGHHSPWLLAQERLTQAAPARSC